ncbi:hypothetical protein BDZ91DRAFT_702211 [Kalaharituber pfeilii]|nr:hypothetical protein BDZ91DRAFT_702211 [Kalaharituber pfeilii]
MASTAAAPKKVVEKPEKLEKLEKPEKPDEGKFLEEQQAIETELQVIREQLRDVQDKLSHAEPARSRNGNGSQNPIQQRQTKLREEQANIRNSQAVFKASKEKTHDQIKVLDTSLKAKVAEQKDGRSKIPFKTVADIDAAISRLEAEIESGTMKLVDERKAVADIPQYRKQKKALQALDAGQLAIEQDRAKIAELKAQLGEDPEQKRLSDRYTEINAELDKIKSEQDEVYKNLNSLRDERTRLKNLDREKWDAKKKLEDEFFSKKKAYQLYEKAAAQARRERFRKEREAKEREYRRRIAAEKMEEASRPAYTSEIQTCENLIAHFDPTSPEALAGKTKASLLKDAGLKAEAKRVVDKEPQGTKLVKVDEDYFVGKPKKGKKGSNKGSGTATPTGGATEDKGKFQLNHGLLVELGKVGVRAPTGWDDIPACVETLREKLQWYKENSERVTKENIAKAQREIDRLEGKPDQPEETPNVEEEPEAVKADDEEEKPLPVPTTVGDPSQDATAHGVRTEEKAE